MNEEFCQKCGQKISVGNMLSNLFSKNCVELEDGYYCLKCGKLEVERRRSKPAKTKREIKTGDTNEQSSWV